MRKNRTHSDRSNSRRPGGKGVKREDVRRGDVRRGEVGRGGAVSRVAAADDERGVRLNKYIARAGVSSRRKADELISAGLVKVNGMVVSELGSRISERDEVEVNGRIISPSRHVYILLNKPKNTITTTDDPRERSTVMDLVDLPKSEKSGLFPVGRLDRDTVGVLLLTNDGDLAHRLMHPSYEIDKLYRVRTKDPVKPHQIDLLKSGVELEDGLAAADDIAYIALPDHHQIGIRIHEGRTRQIRRMFEAVGHEVVHLERVRYAGLTTKGVRPGKWRRLQPDEVRRLRRQVKMN